MIPLHGPYCISLHLKGYRVRSVSSQYRGQEYSHEVKNDVVLTSMRRDGASMSIRRHFGTICPLDGMRTLARLEQFCLTEGSFSQLI